MKPLNTHRESGKSPAAPRPAQRGAAQQRPAGARPVMFQRWENLLFIHWKREATEIQRTLPEGLTVDTFGGAAYLGVVPFFMRKVRPAGLPAVPWLSNFQELNVRTYVRGPDGSPGVWFYSLDCNQPLAVWAARRFFHLPYFHASMDWGIRGRSLHYESRRKNDAANARFVYESVEGPGSRETCQTRESEVGSLEFFLLERYCLFARKPEGRLCRGQVAHVPYRFRLSTPEQWSERPLELAGFPVHGRMPDHCCVAENQAVRIYPLRTVGAHMGGEQSRV